MADFLTAGFDPDFVPYEIGVELQESIHREVAAGIRADTVILLEHEAVYTAGKRTEGIEYPKDGTRVIESSRGGKITWHGPGQLVGYPIMKLPQPFDVVGYVRWLEQVLIDTIADWGLYTERVADRSGVWVPKPNAPHEKVAAIGIRVADKTTMHGFALNCNNSLVPYENIIACGISDAGTTTLTRELGFEITPAMAAEQVQKHLKNITKVKL